MLAFNHPLGEHTVCVGFSWIVLNIVEECFKKFEKCDFKPKLMLTNCQHKQFLKDNLSFKIFSGIGTWTGHSPRLKPVCAHVHLEAGADLYIDACIHFLHGGD